MTLLEIQAIRALPEEYVVEGVRAVRSENYLVAACPNLPAIIYDPTTKEWLVMNTAMPVKTSNTPQTDAASHQS